MRFVKVATMPMFQFTHPGRGATIGTLVLDDVEVQFQFTHPGRGATDEDYRNYTINFLFQFTHPGRGATATK